MAGPVEKLAKAIEKAGSWYGMSLHWGKTQSLAVCSTSVLRDTTGKKIQDTGSLLYLGGLLTSHGRADSEVSRKLGTAKGDFDKLQTVWRHANISRSRKIHFLYSLVISRLLCGLSSLWLVRAQLRRLDGFYARCLRRVLGIPSAYISRISNAKVFERAGVAPLSHQLLRQQLCLLRRVAQSPAGGPMRRDTLVNDSLRPQIGVYIRRVGRPRQDWTSQLMREGSRLLGVGQFESLLLDRSGGAAVRWTQALDRLFKRG